MSSKTSSIGQQVSPATTGATVESRIHELVQAGKCKQAVELAKEHHKRTASPASERTLVETYVARIRQFQEKGAMEDAGTLIKLVRDRFPAHQSLLSLLEVRTTA